ncbi:SRPBCC domain-containing protein [Aquimarina sp. MMG015]|uniref:SRPBCC family protein n=1 Tax=Aquimarina TaxID=290174 RepID=UPI000419E31C|nr:MULTISPECIES: SRPBCC domain-containing protein [Aquimarina]AXT55087.1 SRPBCC domain-containing protein [Aquimarina sp. AD1]MBQ4802046.1 SRPBCC domain-containing protein [Aquimarina sp. MMG015]RKN02324.1 SRPBCC domain-containing protein [Aquimarina sp. AD1]
MKDVISKEQIFTHSIDKLWNAISIQEEISTWFLPADFKAEVGYQYTFHSPDKENCKPIVGTVKEAKPYTLIYTWTIQGTDVETTVVWRLEEIASGTKLSLEHSGISNYDGETAVEMFTSFDGGWDNCIKDLLNYITQEVHAE